MSRSKNAKSPTAALRERVTDTYAEMRGTPDSPESGHNPWDVMLQNDGESLRPRRLPHFDWTYLAAALVVAALVIGLAL